jgi:hypothetical protein
MSLDFTEYNQLLAERYEDLMESGEQVVLEHDFIPLHQFSVTMDLMIQEMQQYFEARFEEIKGQMLTSVESFWVEEANCIISRFSLWGNKLFVELPRSHFLWPHEANAMLEAEHLPSC